MAVGAWVLMSACEQAVPAAYQQSDVEIISVRTAPAAAGVEIRYRPLWETTHHSPGAQLALQDGRRRLSFVRCERQRRCEVNVPARPVDEGVLSIQLPAGAPVEAVFADGMRRLD